MLKAFEQNGFEIEELDTFRSMQMERVNVNSHQSLVFSLSVPVWLFLDMGDWFMRLCRGLVSILMCLLSRL